jgi:hypothetical protein
VTGQEKAMLPNAQFLFQVALNTYLFNSSPKQTSIVLETTKAILQPNTILLQCITHSQVLNYN